MVVCQLWLLIFSFSPVFPAYSARVYTNHKWQIIIKCVLNKQCSCRGLICFVKCLHRDTTNNAKYMLLDYCVSHRQVVLVFKSANPSGAPEFTSGFSGVRVSLSLMFCMFCRSFFVLLYFFFWPLCCLFLFDIRILITPSVSSNHSL